MAVSVGLKTEAGKGSSQPPEERAASAQLEDSTVLSEAEVSWRGVISLPSGFWVYRPSPARALGQATVHGTDGGRGGAQGRKVSPTLWFWKRL